MDVGVGVVHDVVGDPPHVAVRPAQVEGVPDEAVDQRGLRIGAVEGVVRDAEPDPGEPHPHQHR